MRVRLNKLRQRVSDQAICGRANGGAVLHKLREHQSLRGLARVSTTANIKDNADPTLNSGRRNRARCCDSDPGAVDAALKLTGANDSLR